MTKEEAVNKAIEIEFGLGNTRSIRQHNSSLVKIAEHVYDLLQPSLPSNLDEAAEGEIKDFRFIREINYSSAKIEFNSIPKLKNGNKVRILILKENSHE